MNVGPYCPVDPKTKMNYVQSFVAQTLSELVALQVDGIYYDNIGSDGSFFCKGLVDANGDNVPDQGNGPSGYGWFNGT
jgi:hypothetical protein